MDAIISQLIAAINANTQAINQLASQLATAPVASAPTTTSDKPAITAEPVVSAPTTSAPAVEAPVVDTPVAESSVAATFVEAPTAEAPVADTPAPEAPLTDTPAHGVTLDELKKVATDAARRRGKDFIYATLAVFGVTGLGQLDPSQYAAAAEKFGE